MNERLTIKGHPAILKNSKQVVTIKGRKVPIESKAARRYRKSAMPQLKQQWAGKPPIAERVNAAIVSYGAWKEDGGNTPDASNLYQMPEDLLQAAKVIEDDRQIVSHDGSRRVCLCDLACPLKQKYKAGPKKGQLKPDCGAIQKCPFERVEIELDAVVTSR